MSKEGKTVGELLKSARERRKLCLSVVAQEICVKSTYLKDIEENRYEDLPEITFSTGFVKSYARFLKMSAEQVSTLTEDFKVAYLAYVSEKPEAPKVEMLSEKRSWLPGWFAPVMGVGGVLACWGLVSGANLYVGEQETAVHVEREKAQLAAVQATLPKVNSASLVEVAPQVAESAVDIASVVVSAIESNGDAQPVNDEPKESGSLFLPAANASTQEKLYSTSASFRLQAREDAWVKLANPDGTEIWSGVLREGQSYKPQHSQGVLLSTSNAGALLLGFGLAEAVPLGERGEIVQHMEVENAVQLSSAAFGASR